MRGLVNLLLFIYGLILFPADKFNVIERNLKEFRNQVFDLFDTFYSDLVIGIN